MLKAGERPQRNGAVGSREPDGKAHVGRHHWLMVMADIEG